MASPLGKPTTATRMFIDLFYHLRQHGLKVSSTEWLALIEALGKGMRGPI